jgi:hypothetical protein
MKKALFLLIRIAIEKPADAEVIRETKNMRSLRSGFLEETAKKPHFFTK